MQRATFAVFVIALLNCGAPAHPLLATTERSADAARVDASAPDDGMADDGSAEAAAPVARDGGGDTEAAATPPAPPAPVVRTGTKWPYHSWTRAEAVVFNQIPYDITSYFTEYAYDDSGWNSLVVKRVPVTLMQAQQSERRVFATLGDVAVSKCAIPRHALVLFDGDTPIASINVCFECGDIMLWPHWGPEPDYAQFTDKQWAEFQRAQKYQMGLYKRVFPQWKRFFLSELHIDSSQSE
jgi:hypothetical protein